MSNNRELADLISQAGGTSEGVLAGRRNLIINGAMQVWQRGDFAVADRGYFADRWSDYFNPYTSATKLTTSLPDGFSSGASYVSDTATALRIFQRIEGDTAVALNNKKATLSFYIKGSAALAGVAVNSTLATADSKDDFSTRTVIENGTSVNIATAWQRYEHTFDLTGVDVSNGIELRIFTVTCPTGAAMYITGVQLELGSVATPFEHRSYGEELALCQRYYYKFDNGSVPNYGAVRNSNIGSRVIHVPFPVTMRATPAISYSGNNNLGSVVNQIGSQVASIQCDGAATGSSSWITSLIADAEL